MDEPTDFIAGAYADLTALILAQWPEVAARLADRGIDVANGIWQVEHLSQVPYGTVTPPYAVIHVEDCVPADTEGSTCDAYLWTVDIYLVQQVKGPLSGIQRKLIGLLQRINNTATDWIDIKPGMPMSWNDNLPPNLFFAQKKMKHRAGRLRLHGVVKQSYFDIDAEIDSEADTE